MHSFSTWEPDSHRRGPDGANGAAVPEELPRKKKRKVPVVDMGAADAPTPALGTEAAVVKKKKKRAVQAE